MFGVSLPHMTALSLAAIFYLAGAIQLAGPRTVREAYARWEFPPGFHRVTGLLEILAASFLVLQPTRPWGVALAGFVTFGAVVTLLDHREYLAAVPGVILMGALVPALLPSPV